ncbi:hypothetical protein L7F22_035673 [Adiantum nelumboides]|nr:hypothetical protein [Adiantum nelumboides]
MSDFCDASYGSGNVDVLKVGSAGVIANSHKRKLSKSHGRLVKAWDLQARKEATMAVRCFFYAKDVPFWKVRSLYFLDMIFAVGKVGPSYKSPSCTSLRTKDLVDEVRCVDRELLDIRDKWKDMAVVLSVMAGDETQEEEEDVEAALDMRASTSGVVGTSSLGDHDMDDALRDVNATDDDEVLGKFNRARASRLTLPHFQCETPLFMPVGTQGTIKGLTNTQLEDVGCQIILGNTYHLALRPGAELIDELGGLHNFMNWPRSLLTDSGGFQMVSLLHLADITEEGVTFQSPVDGKPMLLTPEESITIQNKIGADIIMALDDVVKTTTTGPRVEEAMYRTLRWIKRCINAHKRPTEQNLFGIIQGGLDPHLRDICVKGLVALDLPGYAIGGLAGGEEKDSFWRVVAQCTAGLPEDKPRYVMGVGFPLDIVVCSALGADMYDCVYPTRTARFGTALVPEGVLKLKHASMATDVRPLDDSCSCMVCKRYTRAYLHSLVTKEAMGSQLVSYHNVAYMMKLSRDLHQSILQGQFPEFVQGFLRKQFPLGDVPEWVCNAMEVAGIDISMCCAPLK